MCHLHMQQAGTGTTSGHWPLHAYQPLLSLQPLLAQHPLLGLPLFVHRGRTRLLTLDMIP